MQRHETHTHTKHTVIDSVGTGRPGFALTANVAGGETARQTDRQMCEPKEKYEKRKEEKKKKRREREIERERSDTEPDNEWVLKMH